MDRFWRVLKFIVRSTKRLVVLVVGLAVTAGGIAMLALPGPGFLVIIIGLAILATEFAWAEYLLHKAKEQALKAKDKAQERIKWRLGKRRAVEPDPVVTPTTASEPAPEAEPTAQFLAEVDD